MPNANHYNPDAASDSATVLQLKILKGLVIDYPSKPSVSQKEERII